MKAKIKIIIDAGMIILMLIQMAYHLIGDSLHGWIGMILFVLIIVYRRSEAELPARAEEVHHAKEEGVIFDLLVNPTEILVNDNGWVRGIRYVRMELGEPDASGRRRPLPVKGSEFVMDVDTVIMSLGTSPNPLISSSTKGLEVNRRKCIVAEELNGKTSKKGVYAGGDAVTGAATVILAMEAGRAGASGIHEYLSE